VGGERAGAICNPIQKRMIDRGVFPNLLTPNVRQYRKVVCRIISRNKRTKWCEDFRYYNVL